MGSSSPIFGVNKSQKSWSCHHPENLRSHLLKSTTFHLRNTMAPSWDISDHWQKSLAPGLSPLMKHQQPSWWFEINLRWSGFTLPTASHLPPFLFKCCYVETCLSPHVSFLKYSLAPETIHCIHNSWGALKRITVWTAGCQSLPSDAAKWFTPNGLIFLNGNARVWREMHENMQSDSKPLAFKPCKMVHIYNIWYDAEYRWYTPASKCLKIQWGASKAHLLSTPSLTAEPLAKPKEKPVLMAYRPTKRNNFGTSKAFQSRWTRIVSERTEI